MSELFFTVMGEPVAKGRARRGRGRHVYTPEETVRFERRVALDAEIAMREGCTKRPLLEGAVELVVDAFFAPRKGAKHEAPVRKTTKPDASNTGKGIEDAMNGIVYVDDARICDTRCRKWWQVPGKPPCVEIRVTSLDGEWQ